VSLQAEITVEAHTVGMGPCPRSSQPPCLTGLTGIVDFLVEDIRADRRSLVGYGGLVEIAGRLDGIRSGELSPEVAIIGYV
jgi:hypothetical protein